MRTALTRAIALLAMAAFALSTGAEPILYATAGAGNTFVRIDVTTQTATTADGTMYGSVNNLLYRVDASTGEATLATRLQGVSRVMGLAIAPVPAPAIRATPTLQPKAAYIGKRADFTVSATGVPPLTYQWRLNGQNLPGETNKTLTLATVQPADEGDYTVEVGNPGGTIVSHSARLWVVPTNEFQKFVFTNAANARLPYLIRFPLNYDPARRYPLVVKITGGPWHEGTLPADFWNWPRVALQGSYERETRDPVILVYPTQRRDVAGSTWTSQELRVVAELLDWLIAEFPVDKDRVYAFGGSITLWPTVELLRLRHDQFAAALLTSGSISARPEFKDLPIWTLQTLAEGIGLGAFAQQLRTFGGHPIHTEFKTASHADVAYAGDTPMVVEWLMAQRRGQRAAGSPTVTIDRLDTTLVRRTGATGVTLSGSVHALGGSFTGLTWNNAGTRFKGDLTVTNAWVAASIPLAPEKTNVIVVTAAVDASWILGQTATTTFSDTVSVFSTPVRLRLARQGSEAILDWTGGVPPFSVQRAPALGGVPWTELLRDVKPPVTVPTQPANEFYRVIGH